MGLAFWVGWFAVGAVLMLLLMGFMAYFFRDPRRSIPLNPESCCAADGK
jgi:hypothetical protein